jgi:hypothetical protein
VPINLIAPKQQRGGLPKDFGGTGRLDPGESVSAYLASL